MNHRNYIIGHARDVAYVALFVALITVSAYLAIPSEIPFTLQSFGIYLTLSAIGGKRGTAAVCCYVAMGAIGLPVFAGVKGGLGVILGPTGGYIFGFVLGAVAFWIIETIFKKSLLTTVFSTAITCIVYLVCGTFWYATVYLGSMSKVIISTAMTTCALPFVFPEIVKILLSTILVRKLKTKISF